MSNLHCGDEAGLGQDVILKLNVEDAAPLSVHHQESIVKILKFGLIIFSVFNSIAYEILCFQLVIYINGLQNYHCNMVLK